MDHKHFRILGLAGSLRRASFHRGILRAAHEVAPEWMSCESFDLARIPYFNQDVEDQGYPEPVEELREKIRAYEAVLIATPEYDYAIPGVLTAALDWTLRSRYDPTPFRHKPVGIVGASPGGVGTVRGQMVLRQILLHPPAYVMPEPQMLIPLSRQKFDAQTGDLLDEETRDRLRRFLEARTSIHMMAGSRSLPCSSTVSSVDAVDAVASTPIPNIFPGERPPPPTPAASPLPGATTTSRDPTPLVRSGGGASRALRPRRRPGSPCSRRCPP